MWIYAHPHADRELQRGCKKAREGRDLPCHHGAGDAEAVIAQRMNRAVVGLGDTPTLSIR